MDNKPSFYPKANVDWLSQYSEAILEPELKIVDPHHHLFTRPHLFYSSDNFLADLRTGHNVVKTVIVEVTERYRVDGPEELRPVGETEFAVQLGDQITGPTKVCAGIVGFADLTMGSRVQPVLEAHLAAGRGRFKGIRQGAAFEASPEYASPGHRAPAGLLLDKKFREGFSNLSKFDLSFDAWLFHPQIGELTSLAREFDDTKIVMDHLGCPLGIGIYATDPKQIFATWKKSIQEISTCPNVYVKLGGLGLRQCGFAFHERSKPPSSQQLAEKWRPFIEVCIDAFGPNRCMFESNFPMDKISCGYGTLWNAFKLVSKGLAPTERAALFANTASEFYKL